MQKPTDPCQAAAEMVARQLLTMPAGWHERLADDVVRDLGPLLSEIVRSHVMHQFAKERGHDELRLLKEHIADAVGFLQHPPNVSRGAMDYALDLADRLKEGARRLPDKLPAPFVIMTGDPRIDIMMPE